MGSRDLPALFMCNQNLSNLWHISPFWAFWWTNPTVIIHYIINYYIDYSFSAKHLRVHRMLRTCFPQPGFISGMLQAINAVSYWDCKWVGWVVSRSTEAWWRTSLVHKNIGCLHCHLKHGGECLHSHIKPDGKPCTCKRDCLHSHLKDNGAPPCSYNFEYWHSHL